MSRCIVLNPKKGAFSLMELLVAVAIVAVLLVIAIPAIGSIRNASIAVKCLGNLRNFGTAVLAFSGDNNGLPWWNGKGYPASAEPPSTRPNFEAWVRPYLHKEFKNRLRCPLKPANAGDYTYEYAGNSSLCWYFPKLRSIPAPQSRVVLAMEFGDYNFYWTAPMNAVMWGIGNGEGAMPPAQPDANGRPHYHGSPKNRGLHMFFLDGHAQLVCPEGGNWGRGKSPTYGNATNGGLFYDYHQFREMSEGSLIVR